MPIIRWISKFAFTWSKGFIELSGVAFVCILVAAGISHSPIGIVVGIENGNLTRLTQGNVPYYLDAILAIYIIGTIGIGIYELVKIFRHKQKVNADRQVIMIDNQSMFVKLLKWLRDN